MGILIAIVVVYFFIVFVVLRLVTPFIGFRKYQPLLELPEEMKVVMIDLENKSVDQLSYLQNVYNLILNKTLYQWKHTRFKAATNIPRLFVKNLNEIWQTKDFLYCTAINYAAYVLLVNSKFFKTDDIKVRHVFVNFIIHQYLQVKVNGNWIDFDPAGTVIRGKPLGVHLSFFG